MTLQEPKNPYFISYEDFAYLSTDEQGKLNIKFSAFEQGYKAHQEYSKPKLFSEVLPKQNDRIIVYGKDEEARELEFDERFLENNIYLYKEDYFSTFRSSYYEYNFTHWKPVDEIVF